MCLQGHLDRLGDPASQRHSPLLSIVPTAGVPTASFYFFNSWSGECVFGVPGSGGREDRRGKGLRRCTQPPAVRVVCTIGCVNDAEEGHFLLIS